MFTRKVSLPHPVIQIILGKTSLRRLNARLGNEVINILPQLKYYSIDVNMNLDLANFEIQPKLLIFNWERFSEEALESITELLDRGAIIQNQTEITILEAGGIPKDNKTPIQSVYEEFKFSFKAELNTRLSDSINGIQVIISREQDQLGDWPMLATFVRTLLKRIW